MNVELYFIIYLLNCWKNLSVKVSRKMKVYFYVRIIGITELVLLTALVLSDRGTLLLTYSLRGIWGN